jgi:hypothetical protein
LSAAACAMSWSRRSIEIPAAMRRWQCQRNDYADMSLATVFSPRPNPELSDGMRIGRCSESFDGICTFPPNSPFGQEPTSKFDLADANLGSSYRKGMINRRATNRSGETSCQKPDYANLCRPTSRVQGTNHIAEGIRGHVYEHSKCETDAPKSSCGHFL